MTTPIATHLGRTSRARARVSPFASLAADLEVGAGEAERPEWPSSIYRADPCGFARDILGIEPWDRQAEILEALVPDRARVSVRSGHKVSKSNSGAIAALWFFCSFPDARVVCTAPTDRQVNQILWREARRLHARAGRCAACRARDRWGGSRCELCNGRDWIGGEMHELARSGLRTLDFREIVGFTAKEAEAVAGISGANLFYILDEASGIPDVIYEAIEGNRAGGARVLLLGNPTKTEGEFFLSHTEKREFYTTFHLSSEDTPNVRQGREVIPGLAGREWVDEKRREWGEESPLYQVRVRGNFPPKSADSVIALFLVEEAEARWEETPAIGRLSVGVDVAGFGDDDSAIAAGRGYKLERLVAQNGLSEAEIADLVVQTVRELRDPTDEPAFVKVDTTGANGLGARVLALLQDPELALELEAIGINVAERADDPDDFPLLRDQLWFGVADWLEEGGSLPEDSKLARELLAPRYKFDAQRRRKVESKDELRKRLKRSPDRADALGLFIYRRGEAAAERGDTVDDGFEYVPEARRWGSFGKGDRTQGWGRRG